MSDNLTIFGTDYTGVTSIKATGTGNGTLTYIRPQGSQTITENGTVDVTNLASVDVSVSGYLPISGGSLTGQLEIPDSAVADASQTPSADQLGLLLYRKRLGTDRGLG